MAESQKLSAPAEGGNEVSVADVDLGCYLHTLEWKLWGKDPEHFRRYFGPPSMIRIEYKCYNSFDEIPTPCLAKEEEECMLTADMKRLRILLKKYQEVKQKRGASSPFFDIDCLMSIISDCNNDDNEGPEYPHFVVCTQGTGPLDFYLVRLEDVDRARFINYWISDHVDELQPIPAPSYELLGRVVACRRPFSASHVETLWLRGSIKAFNPSKETVLCHTLEYGVDHEISYSKVRMLPEALARFGRLSIPSQLGNLVLPINEPNFSPAVRREFMQMVSRTTALKSENECYDAETGKLKVRLRLGEEDIATMIEARWKSRMDIPKEFVNDSRSDKLLNLCCLSRQLPPPDFHANDEMQLDNCRNVIVTQVTHPGHFYVKYVTSKTTSAMNKKLQNYYNDKNREEVYKLRGGRPFLDRYYVFKFKSSGLWEPCRVTGINHEIRTCTIYAVNLNLFLDHVDFEDLLEIRIDLITRPAKSILCSLTDVVPPNNAVEWEVQSIEAFKSIVLGKQFHCMISSRQEDYNPCGYPNNCLKLEVVLLGKTSNETVNAQLCGLGLATSKGHSANKMNLRESDNTPKPMSHRACSHFKSKATARNSNVPQKTATKKKAKTELNDPVTPAIKNRYPPFYRYWHKNRSFIEGYKAKVPSSAQDQCKIVWVSSCSSPGCIYVQDVRKLQNLHEMTMRLTVQAEKSPYFPYALLSEGDFVAVQLTEYDFFYRGFVKNVCSLESIKIVLMDFGNCISVNVWRIRVLPTEYLRVPGFASRVYLDVVPHPDLYYWSSSACEAAQGFVQERADGCLWYFRLTQTETLALEEYNQEMIFDHEEKLWVKGPPQQSEDDVHMNLMKEHPLLKKLYLTMGGHIFCQSTGPRNSVYRPPFRVKEMSTYLKVYGFLPETETSD